MKNKSATNPIVFGDRNISIEDICAIGKGGCVALSKNKEWQGKIKAGAKFLRQRLDSPEPLYGVTTGYGASCGVKIPVDLISELPAHLVRYHGCGLGRYLSPEEGATVVAARLASLSRGFSGVRMVILERLADLINHKMIPVIPEEGSVGASGDLTPLSYVAAVLTGERKTYYKGRVTSAAQALRSVNLKPISLLPKEGLALMNGTSMMTGLACLAFEKAERLVRLSCEISALAVEAFMGNRDHYRPELFALKPFKGQARAAKSIYKMLSASRRRKPDHPLQDRYSLRCAPHVIGVLADALDWMRSHIEIELNSSNDNPLIDGKSGLIMHGGHFYGGHIAFVMDSMKNAVANIADLLDRQVALLTDPLSNNGLPDNLSGATGKRSAINHGFKALQIGVSAWTAEALKLTMPASVFSRSTECHNQDKVSMGTIAARDGLRVIQLTEQVAAAALMIMHQGVSIRLRRGEITPTELTPALKQLMERTGQAYEPLDEDRPLDQELRGMMALLSRS